MTKREQSGLILAATARIVEKDGVWLVPSQKTAAKTYTVDLQKESCTCPDHAEWSHKCKHLHAVEIVARRDAGTFQQTEEIELTPGGRRYKQDWPSYNLAQTQEKARFQKLLYELCAPLKIPRGIGRPRLPLADTVFAVVFKVYATTSIRRFMSDFEDAKAKGYIRKPLHYNALARYLDWEPMTKFLMQLIERSSLPLRAIENDFAVDSTGFSASRFVRWFDEKYGVERTGHDWVKVHVMSGVKTNIVTAVEIRKRTANDSPIFRPLASRTAKNFVINEISADKAYSSMTNIEHTFELGGIPFIPFKNNALGERGGHWDKMLLYYQLNREDFLKHYHKRSNVESTFAMIKAKFRDHVRSKTPLAMKNEALAKILAHNICCVISSQIELGIEPIFWPKDEAEQKSLA